LTSWPFSTASAEVGTLDIISSVQKSYLKKEFHDFRNVPDCLDETHDLKAIPDQKSMRGLFDLVAFPQKELLKLFELCTGQICEGGFNRISDFFVPIT